MKLYLPSEEIHVWFSLINKEDFSSRAILRFLLARYLNCSPDSLVFEKTTQGKLFLPEHPHLFFNIAHSGDLLALILSHAPVGIDLEKKRKVKAIALAHKFFSLEEIDFITSKGEAFVEEKFLQLWTAKEAVLKGDGRGITAGLRNVFAIIEKENVVSLTLEKKLWYLTSLSLESSIQQDATFTQKYAVAVATLREDPLIRWYDFTSSVTLDSSCHFKILT